MPSWRTTAVRLSPKTVKFFMLFRAVLATVLNLSGAPNNTQDKHDHGNDQDKVDECTCGKGEKANGPADNKNDSDDVENV